MRGLNLLDTVWVMILPGAISAYNVFLFRTFFLNIPSELKDSAYIDGASDLVVLFKIILPLSKRFCNLCSIRSGRKLEQLVRGFDLSARSG